MVGKSNRGEDVTDTNLSSEARLREAVAMAFYEAEQHKPHKEGYCDKCGFCCHCEVGHVLAIAQQTWFRLATERLQIILDEPAHPAGVEPPNFASYQEGYRKGAEDTLRDMIDHNATRKAAALAAPQPVQQDGEREALKERIEKIHVKYNLSVALLEKSQVLNVIDNFFDALAATPAPATAAIELAAQWVDDNFSDPDNPFAGDALREKYGQATNSKR